MGDVIGNNLGQPRLNGIIGLDLRSVPEALHMGFVIARC